MQRLYTVPAGHIAAVFGKGPGLNQIFQWTPIAAIDATDFNGTPILLRLTLWRDGSAHYEIDRWSDSPQHVLHIHNQYAEFTSNGMESTKSAVVNLEELFPRLKLYAVHNSHLIEAVNDVKKKVADEMASVKSEITAIKDLMIEALAKYEWHRDVQRAIAENKLSLSE